MARSLSPEAAGSDTYRGRVFVTGATGFIGNCTVPHLRGQGWNPVTAGRRSGADFQVDLDREPNWAPALEGCDAVVHLAGRAHIQKETASDPLAAFMATNCHGTVNLARAAAAAGVKKFVFVSSVAVHGSARPVVRETDEPLPDTDYGRSKLAAEEALRQIGNSGPMAITILRPPLVYGPGVGARFLQLLNACYAGWPLPFAQVHNRRSFLSVRNLAGVIATCLANDAANGKTYLVADQNSLSTPELIEALCRALNRPNRSFNFPTPMITLAGKLLGKSAEIDRLLGSLELDTRLVRSDLGWADEVTPQQTMAEMAQWYAGKKRQRLG